MKSTKKQITREEAILRARHISDEEIGDVMKVVRNEMSVEEWIEKHQKKMEESSKFEKSSHILNVFEIVILGGELSISDEPGKIGCFTKMKMDVENEPDLSGHERKILIGQIVYLNALAHIHGKE